MQTSNPRAWCSLDRVESCLSGVKKVLGAVIQGHIKTECTHKTLHVLTHTQTRTCRSVFSISVASSCLPCLAISIISWIMPMRRW